MSSRRSSERRRAGSTASVAGGGDAGARKKEQKGDQVLRKVYSKTVQVIVDARMGNGVPSGGVQPASAGLDEARTDKWFNLELEDYDYYREELKTWKGITSLLFPPLAASASPPSPSSSSSAGHLSTHTVNFAAVPTLAFEVVLDLTDLPAHQSLALSDPAKPDRRIRLDAIEGSLTPTRTRKNIVLERWTVGLTPPMPPPPGPELPTVYRHAIVHFRALFTLVRTLPVWSLQKKLKKGGEQKGLKIGCLLSTAEDEQREDLVALDESLAQDNGAGGTTSYSFAPFQTPLGLVQTAVAYRTNADFVVEDTETMLSDRFIDEDFFRPSRNNPSIAYHQPRAGSVPDRTGSSSRVATTGKPTYGSLSSAHLLNPQKPASEAKGKEREGLATSPSSLTAKLRELPAFAVPPPAPAAPSNGSALTARLIGRKTALPPLTSNALSTTSPPSGTPHLSSSPGSGPSASIRMSSGMPRHAPIPSPRSPSMYPGSHSSGSGGGGPSQSSTVGARPMPMQQPMLRRYSSSHRGAPRSFGQSSSGGSMDPAGSSAGRRRLVGGFEGFTTSSPSGYVGASYGRASGSQASADDLEDINTFIALVDSKPALPTFRKAPPSSSASPSPTGGGGAGRSQADEYLRKLMNSVHGSSSSMVYASSPEAGLSPPSRPSLSGGHRLTSLTGRPGSALDRLGEEEEPATDRPAPSPVARHGFPSASRGQHYWPRQSPLSVSPGLTAPMMAQTSSGGVPFPRYVSSSSRRASADAAAASPSAVAGAGGGGPTGSGLGRAPPGSMGSTASTGTGATQFGGSSFDEGPVGKLELSLEDQQHGAAGGGAGAGGSGGGRGPPAKR